MGGEAEEERSRKQSGQSMHSQLREDQVPPEAEGTTEKSMEGIEAAETRAEDVAPPEVEEEEPPGDEPAETVPDETGTFPCIT